MRHRVKLVPARVFAIDWSGDKRNARRKIWLAETVGGQLVRLECGRTREEIYELLIDEVRKDHRFIVGLDFGFSFPASFCGRFNAKNVYEVWNQIAAEGERWLSECNAPFWGKPGRKKCLPGEAFRRTELDIACNRVGAKPKSVFQIGGAGAVGTGSIRGMPVLKRLHDSGFSIWPFDPPAWPLVVEIYPRLFTGPVKKSCQASRELYLTTFMPALSQEFYDVASSNEDAFDAAISALVMAARGKEFELLQQGKEAWELIEGRIWH